MIKGFVCEHCQAQVPTGRFIGTAHRNHCPFCLWSKHVDKSVSGDRKSACRGMMEPIGLTFKKVGLDKYGQPKQGEIMVVQRCQKCGQFSINRLAADDEVKSVWELFQKSLAYTEEIKDIKLLKKEDEEEVKKQLFGKL